MEFQSFSSFFNTNSNNFRIVDKSKSPIHQNENIHQKQVRHLFKFDYKTMKKFTKMKQSQTDAQMNYKYEKVANNQKKRQ